MFVLEQKPAHVEGDWFNLNIYYIIALPNRINFEEQPPLRFFLEVQSAQEAAAKWKELDVKMVFESSGRGEFQITTSKCF